MKEEGETKAAFTLVEVLISVTIIALLAGLIFAAAAAAKRRANEAPCISQMKQIYTAICLYEENDNEVSPPTLMNLPSLDQRLCRCQQDPVMKQPKNSKGFPARLFIPGDNELSSFRISYAYLRTYPPYDTNASKWLEKRQNSNIGILACPWHGKPLSTNFDANPHGPMMSGPILRINMDGSLFRLAKNRDDYALGSVNDLFYNR